MKKKRYGLPIYLTSSITIGQLCIYYFRKTYAELKKREKTLLIIQQLFLLFVIFASLIFLTYFGYVKKEISFGLFFLYAALHLLFLFLFAVGYTEISYAKRVITDGIFMNTAGKTTKIKPGPWLGVAPKANTAGKMTRPASSDTSRFIHIMILPERNIS